MNKVLLFDADGVITLPEDMFSVIYACSHGFNPVELESFFKGDFGLARVGKADLSELLEQNRDIWRFDGNVDDLLTRWFEAENVVNEELMVLISDLRGQGYKCYLATDQEQYRAKYFREVMFKDKFDGFFISCELGVEKSDPIFFTKVMEVLTQSNDNITPADVLFFDDTKSKVDSASSSGLNAHLYTGIDTVEVAIES